MARQSRQPSATPRNVAGDHAAYRESLEQGHSATTRYGRGEVMLVQTDSYHGRQAQLAFVAFYASPSL